MDASVVVDFVIDSTNAPAAVAAMRGHELRSPDLIDFEVMAAIRRLALSDQLRDDEARQSLRSFHQLRIVRAPSAPLIDRALELRHTVGAGDSIYVALAETLECLLVTADGRLARSHGHQAQIQLVEA